MSEWRAPANFIATSSRNALGALGEHPRRSVRKTAWWDSNVKVQ